MSERIAELLENLDGILEQIPVEHRGMSFERVVEGFNFNENARRLELALALMWAERNAEGRDNLLTHLLDDGTIIGRPGLHDLQSVYRPKNEREWHVACMVAATIVQWLGTSAGCAFLQQAFRSAGGKLSYDLPDTTGYEYIRR